MGTGFFCKECGSVLSGGTCTNDNCSLFPKKQLITVESLPDTTISLSPREPTQQSPDNLFIPKQENSSRFLCFSDWRSQELEHLLAFISGVQPRPDYILYAGDDTERFVQFSTESLLPFISSLYIEIPKAKCQQLPDCSRITRFIVTLHEEIQISEKAARTIVKPLDESIRKIHSYFDKTNLSFVTIADDSVKYYTDDNERAVLPPDDFTREFPGVKAFLGHLGYASDLIAKTILSASKHKFTIIFRYKTPDHARFEHEFRWTIRKTKIITDESYRVRNQELRYILEVSKAFNPSMDIPLLEKFLTENFNIRVLKNGEEYDRQHHFIDLIMHKSASSNSWIIEFKIRPEVLSSFIDRNVFEELAELSNNGLLAVIGNDCPPSHELFITGKNVKNLNFRTHEQGNYLFMGLPGAESIKSTLEERTLFETDMPGADIGPSIFPREKYQDALQQLSRPEHGKKIKIIISHPPPFKCLDLARRFGQRYIGSIALRETIEKDGNIRMVACGHVHLHGGKHDTLNRATVINCSSHDDETALGNVAIVDIDDETGDITNTYWKQLGSKMQVIWGTGPEKAAILEKGGYRTPEDLLTDSLQTIHQNVNSKIGKKTIAKIHRRAKALVCNEMSILDGKPPFTTEDIANGVIVDIETDLNQSDIWCIGALYKGNYTSFFATEAGNKGETRRILTEFIRYLEELARTNDRLQMFCYSMTNFDFRVLEQLLKKHSLFTEHYEQLPTTDLFHALHGAVAFPLSDLKLKTVAEYLKFPRKSPEDYDGMKVSAEYYSAFLPGVIIPEEEKKRLKADLLLYNEEDTRMVEFIWNKVFQI